MTCYIQVNQRGAKVAQYLAYENAAGMFIDNPFLSEDNMSGENNWK